MAAPPAARPAPLINSSAPDRLVLLESFCSGARGQSSMTVCTARLSCAPVASASGCSYARSNARRCLLGFRCNPPASRRTRRRCSIRALYNAADDLLRSPLSSLRPQAGCLRPSGRAKSRMITSSWICSHPPLEDSLHRLFAPPASRMECALCRRCAPALKPPVGRPQPPQALASIRSFAPSLPSRLLTEGRSRSAPEQAHRQLTMESGSPDSKLG